MKKFLSLFASVLVCLLSFSGGEIKAEAETAGDITVVVLGDSIARGYGLANPEKEGFPKVLEEKLLADFPRAEVFNYGVDGLDGSGLCNQLEKDLPKELYDCDCVIISIGGNNVLRSLSQLDGLANIAGGIKSEVFIDYFRYLFSRDETEREALDYARETLNMLFKSANDAFEGEGFSRLLETASENLQDELPRIVSHIKTVNPQTKIIIQTVYNPYEGLHIELKGIEESLDLSKVGERAVISLNSVIESLSSELGYAVSPVHDGFAASSQRLTNAGFDLFDKVFGVDPHPNAKGHQLMAEIHYSVIKEEENG